MIYKYHKGDVHKVIPQREQVTEAYWLDENELMNLQAFTLKDDTAVYGVFGFQETDGGVVECFALLGRNCRKELRRVIRFWLKLMTCYLMREDIVKFSCTVKSHFEAGRRLMKILGFKPQKKLENYFCGETYLLFERRKI